MEHNVIAAGVVQRLETHGLAVRKRATGTAVDRIARFLPDTLRTQVRILQIDIGQALFEPHQPADIRFYVVKGLISVKSVICGADITVQHAVKGDWLMASQAISCYASTRAICEKKTTVLAVPVLAINDQLHADPDFAHWWWQHMSSLLLALQRHNERLRLTRTIDRIVHYLTTESKGCCGELMLPYSPRIWAEHLNVAQETLLHTLRAMEENGQIARHSRRIRLL